MTNGKSLPSEPKDPDDDQELLEALRRTVTERDPVPPEVTERARRLFRERREHPPEQ